MKERKRFLLHYLVQICTILLFTSSIFGKSTMEFQNVSSLVMMQSLEPLAKTHFLRKLYSQLLFVPVWVEEENISRFSKELFFQIEKDRTLEASSRLKKDAYALEADAHRLYSTYSPLKEKIALEFKIAQLYKGYADYTLYGSINWGAFQGRLYNLRTDEVKAAWITYKPTYTPISLLEQAVFGAGLKQMFQKASPKSYHYDALKKKLYHYQRIANNGGWHTLRMEGILRTGKSAKIVPQLRERLRISGEYHTCKTEETSYYDSCLKKAVVAFQKSHGLTAKGVIGKETLKALNVSASSRVRQIKLNLDRIKWLHERDAKRHLIINIPSFTLYYEEEGRLKQTMRVITGRKKNPTPIFSNTVQTIVLNPHWNIPKSIIQKEMIPKLLKNPNAMRKKGIEIRKGWGKDAPKVDAKSIDWSQYLYSKKMPFHFAQKPGYKNALGKVKFLFPNQFAVYMHDTPNKKLFNRTTRAFSHGCIRLHKPRELLKTFSTFNYNINFKKSQKELKGSKKTFLKLEKSVPVDIVYLTAYVDYAGILQFRNDIYGYDKMQLQSYRKW